MIFSGEMNDLAVRGAGLTLAGTFLVCVATAFLTSFKSIINLSQDAPVAIFSGAAALIATDFGLSGEQLFITVVAALMLCSFLSALLLFLIARLNLIHFFRYIPYPVIGGFLAGTGWLLSTGSLEVMSGSAFNPLSHSFFLSPEVLILWLPGTLLAIGLFILLRYYSHFSILPISLILGVLIFHLILYLSGTSMEQAREVGLLFESVISNRLWPAFAWSDLAMVHWGAVFSQFPVFIVISFIALIGLLLNVSGIELASRKDIDINREVMGNSFSNLLAGLAGSSPAYSSLSLSMLGFKANAYSRMVGLAAALVVIMTLFLGGTFISIFPKAVLGGFLLLLGLFFLWDWVIETRKKMNWPDYCIILAILVSIAWLGFFQGVVLGILLSVVLFVFRFSQVPVVDELSTGKYVQSSRTRSLPHRKILAQQGERIKIFKLSGYLFFGSVNSLVQQIQNEIEVVALPGQLYVIIDFTRTSGIDISSVSSFVRMINKLAGKDNISIIFIAPGSLFEKQIRQHLGQEDGQGILINFANLDQGLKWAEDTILAEQLELFQSQGKKQDQARLFDEVAEDMLNKLEELENAEKIFKKIEDYAQEIKLEKGDTLLDKGRELNGFFWLQQGRISKSPDQTDQDSAVSEYGPGDILNIQAVFKQTKLDNLYKAESSCLLLFFSKDKITDLENKDPQMAARLYALLLRHLTVHG
jgi:SulP family sulfate permease